MQFAADEGWSQTQVRLESYALEAYERRQFEQARLSHDYSVLASFLAEVDLGLGTDPFVAKCARNVAFVQTFAAAIHPKDKPQQVFELLKMIDQQDPGWLENFPTLALAIALVHDQAPPQRWPHYQTGLAKSKNGQLQSAAKVYEYFQQAAQSNRLQLDLSQLSIGELKYVVDIHADFADFEWAAKAQRFSWSRIDQLYRGIAYRHDRIDQNEYHWPLKDYSLPVIQKEGGICVDQAYFMTQVCKSRGIPSVQISGAGSDGYHAWVGYRDQSDWNFEVGRYGGTASFAAGRFFDPQTWEHQSDHALYYATENFLRSENYQWARFHQKMARLLMEQDKLAAADRALETALDLEKKCVDAWDLKILLLERQCASVDQRIEAYQSAARALTRFDEMRHRFTRQLIDFLEQAGQDDAAQKMRLTIARDQGEERPDLAIEALAKPFLESLHHSGARASFSELRKLITRYESQPTYLCDRLLGPYINRCLTDSEWSLAERAIELLLEHYQVDYGSQIDARLKRWQSAIDKARSNAS
ncbi:MAG: tetratricopeptide repeat protein [Opitutales bacterium]